MSTSADNRLATYGSLAPGKLNHHQLAGLRGEWVTGTVKGILVDKGWGAALGFPALVLRDDAPRVSVHLFISPDLPNHWDRLDDFEGSQYRRSLVGVETPMGIFEAWIYLDADPAA
ncbi:MAG: gamma-glutamylcyclotransferase [Sphingomonas sp.]|nr:gamma-glutamylcyclotransferase [Sphingomonas sp.]